MTPEDPRPRPFVLQRDEDETGVSGTGIVATGVEFPDGVVALRWTSEWPTSVVFHERGMESVEAIHGHGGKTRVVWLAAADGVAATRWEQVGIVIDDIEFIPLDIVQRHTPFVVPPGQKCEAVFVARDGEESR